MLGNLILETVNAPGTGADCLLAGAVAGNLPFSFWFASGAPCFYILDDGNQQEWGIGTFTAGSPNKVTRTTVLKNSANTTARLNFLGSTRVYNDIPAERSLWLDNSNNVVVPGTVTTTNLTLSDTNPVRISWRETNRPLNQKNWDAVASGSQLLFRSVNDAFTAWAEWLTVTRSSGHTIGTITVAGSNITLQGAVGIGGGLHATGEARLDSNVIVGQALTISEGNIDNNFRLWGLDYARTIEFTGPSGWLLQFEGLGNNLIYFNNDGVPLFVSEGASGDFRVAGDVVPNATSDERAKRDAAPFTRGLREIIELNPVSYYYNGLGGTIDNGQKRIGLIAQDVLPHFPEMVFETRAMPRNLQHERVPPDPRLPGQLSLDEKPLLYALVNAVRELSVRVVALEDRVAALEACP